METGVVLLVFMLWTSPHVPGPGRLEMQEYAMPDMATCNHLKALWEAVKPEGKYKCVMKKMPKEPAP